VAQRGEEARRGAEESGEVRNYEENANGPENHIKGKFPALGGQGTEQKRRSGVGLNKR